MFITQKKHRAILRERVDIAEREIEDLHTEYGHELREHLQAIKEKAELNKQLTKEVGVLKTELEDLKSEVEAYESALKVHEGRTQATLYIHDDLKTVTPHTKVNKETVEKLIETNRLPFNRKDDEFAINFAILTMAHEAIEQMVFAFEDALVNDLDSDEVDYNSEGGTNE